MIRTYTAKKITYGYIEVDIPDNATDEEIERLVLDQYNRSGVSWDDCSLESIYDSSTRQSIWENRCV